MWFVGSFVQRQQGSGPARWLTDLLNGRLPRLSKVHKFQIGVVIVGIVMIYLYSRISYVTR